MHCNRCCQDKEDEMFGFSKTRCKLCVAELKREYNHKRGLCKSHRYPKDLSGMDFGNLSVLHKCVVDGKPHWMCRCVCGKEVPRLHADLVGLRIKSCGCRRKRTGDKNHLWRGYGAISGGLWSKIKYSATKRNIEFSISIQEAWKLFPEQDGKCRLTGLSVGFSATGTGDYQTASLDRIDSDKGYVIGNIHWIHKDLNWMKNDFDLDYFISMCRRVAQHHKEGT